MTDSDKSYLVYMAVRLLEMRRLLKPTGSIYLHCDPTMSHYLKLVMDAIFGRKNFRCEIVWDIAVLSGFKTKARNLEVDHIIARNKGGTDHPDNLQLLCSHCNRIKGDRGMDYLRVKLQMAA